jgi:hypothetical protein
MPACPLRRGRAWTTLQIRVTVAIDRFQRLLALVRGDEELHLTQSVHGDPDRRPRSLLGKGAVDALRAEKTLQHFRFLPPEHGIHDFKPVCHV